MPEIWTGPAFGGFGGVGTHVRELARWSRHRPRLVRLPPWSVWHPAWSRLAWRWEAARRRAPDPWLLSVARRARGADLVHLHAFPHWWQAYFRPAAPRARFVYTVHQVFLEEDFPAAEWPRWRALQEVEFEAAREAEAVLAVGAWMVPLLAARGVRARHVPNGVALDELARADPERFRRRIGVDGDFVLFAGAFRRYKRPDLFLEAAEATPDRAFVLAGRGATRDAARRLHGRALPANVACLGELPRELLLDGMAAARVLALPSSNEAFGIVLLEAMGLGKAVVAADAGGPKEILADGKTGFLFRPGDAASLREKILAAWDAPDVAAAGRALVEREYDWARVAERVDRVYDEALAGRTAAGGRSA